MFIIINFIPILPFFLLITDSILILKSNHLLKIGQAIKKRNLEYQIELYKKYNKTDKEPKIQTDKKMFPIYSLLLFKYRKIRISLLLIYIILSAIILFPFIFLFYMLLISYFAYVELKWERGCHKLNKQMRTPILDKNLLKRSNEV